MAPDLNAPINVYSVLAILGAAFGFYFKRDLGRQDEEIRDIRADLNKHKDEVRADSEKLKAQINELQVCFKETAAEIQGDVKVILAKMEHIGQDVSRTKQDVGQIKREYPQLLGTLLERLPSEDEPPEDTSDGYDDDRVDKKS